VGGGDSHGDIHVETECRHSHCGSRGRRGRRTETPGPTGWSASNYDQSANRYSPLTQITSANVSTLQRAWSIHLKPVGYSGKLLVDEAIPIVIGNTMYVGSPYGAVIALDATSGAEQWRFQLPNNDAPAKRGIAYWPGGGGHPASIVFGSNAGALYSINAATDSTTGSATAALSTPRRRK
jgi:quinoprotein glucose dehydrogenase